MLAVAMNGEPLPLEHGFPVRMVVPGLYGYVSATKWVVDIEVTRFDRVLGVLDRARLVGEGPGQDRSRASTCRATAASWVPGDVAIGGIAWAQHTGIDEGRGPRRRGRVEQAELGRVPGIDTWRQWAGTVGVRSGDHKLAVRATDPSGYTQTAARADVVPDGATGWHSVSFSAG